MSTPFSDALRHFVLAHIPTVPHLETLLLLWRESMYDWTAGDIAGRLFVPVVRARSIADELCAGGLIGCGGEPLHYWCRPDMPERRVLYAELEGAHSHRLRELTRLIHSRAADTRDRANPVS